MAPVPDALDVAPASRRLSVLWVDERLPDPARDSGSLRMFNLLRLLVAMGHRVDVLTLSRAEDASGQRLLQVIGAGHAGRGATQRPEVWFAREGTRYDAGATMGWLKASVEIALARPDLAKPFRTYLQELPL